MKLSIVIPVYNEEKTVLKLLDKVFKVDLPYGIAKEIVVVNDGSSDKSLKYLQEFRKKIKRQKKLEYKLHSHDKNLGKGAALRTGFEICTGDIILIQDADLEYDPNFFSELLKPVFLHGAVVVYGTRLKNYPLKLWGKERTPLPSHWVGNKFLTLITNLLFNSRLTDMETCYKVFKKEALDGILLKSNRFEIEPEITAKFLKKGHNIFEVPIKTKPRTHREGKKINWTDGFGAVLAICKYRFSN